MGCCDEMKCIHYVKPSLSSVFNIEAEEKNDERKGNMVKRRGAMKHQKIHEVVGDRVEWVWSDVRVVWCDVVGWGRMMW